MKTEPIPWTETKAALVTEFDGGYFGLSITETLMSAPAVLVFDSESS